MSRFVVEFIENGIAKCEQEDGSFVTVEVALLPHNAKNGDILAFDGEKYVILNKETQSKKQDMLSLQARLFGKKK